MTERILNERYALECKVGEGGMAVTYRARDLLLHRTVAIKVMREQFTTDPQFIERFRREAQAAARLSHENIAGVYDTGSADGTHYIVMEFVEGTDLKARLRREGALSILTVLELGRQIAAALEAAHAGNLVHRDIKPHNILINPEGKIKVTDFGIAKVANDSEDTGVIIGSVHYLSPEQARGETTTAASDLYALGAVLFEMITGRTVFEGENPLAVAHKQIYEVPPALHALRPDVPAALEALVLRCLEKDAKARYQSAAEVKAALTQIANQMAQESTVVLSAPPPPSSSTIVYQKPQHVEPAQPAAPHPVLATPATAPEPVPARGGGGSWAIAIVFLLLLAGVSYGIFSMLRPTGNRDRTPPPTIPKVLGMTETAARQLLEQRNIIVTVLQDTSAEYAKGQVCKQDPAAGLAVTPETQVTIWISQGAPDFTMPDVAGMSQNVAKTQIRDAAQDEEKTIVTFVTKTEASDEVPKGFVIRTDPTAGAAASRKQAKVTLVLSSGPKVDIGPPPVDTYTPGQAVDLGSPSVHIRIELENPVGSAPTTLLDDTYKPGDTIPDQHFQRGKPEDKAVVRMYAGKDDGSEMQVLDESVFPREDTPAAPDH